MTTYQSKIHKDCLKRAIAHELKVKTFYIDTVEEWTNCYFVTFFGRSPRFVSKKNIYIVNEINMEAAPRVLPIHRNKATVIAHTPIKESYKTGYPCRGLLLLHHNTGKQYWMTNERPDRFDPLRGDIITYCRRHTYGFVEPLKERKVIKLKSKIA